MKLTQVEAISTTDKVKEGSKNGLRSDLRSSNLKIFIGGHAPEAAACSRMQSRIQPDHIDLLPPGLGTHRNNELIIQHQEDLSVYKLL